MYRLIKTLCLLIALLLSQMLTAQTAFKKLLEKSNFQIQECSCGSCATLSRKNESTYAPIKSSGSSSTWDQPIRVHFLIDDQINVEVQTLLTALAEDSQIAIAEGLYCGEGDAFVYAGQQEMDLTEMTDQGIPLQTDAIHALVSTLDDLTFSTIFDSYLIKARDCWGAQKVNTIVRNIASGPQEIATRGFAPADNIHPSETFKQGAYDAVNFRNHAVSHSGGWNHPNHQNGPDPTQRPMQTSDGESYGWSTTGLLGYSGGTALGIGPSGEDIAGYIRASHADWTSIIPNLGISNLTGPSSTDTGMTETFSAESNKDIGNENWLWEFTDGTNSFNEAGNSVNVSFPNSGTWNYTVTLRNDCEGQQAMATGTLEVLSGNTVPSANCKVTHTVVLDSAGEGILTVEDLDNNSSDAEGTVELSFSGNSPGPIELSCNDLGIYTETLIVIDEEGLRDTCSTEIIIEDEMAPLLTTQDLTVEVAEGSMTTLTIEDLVTSVTDNCSALTPSAVMADRSLTFQDTEKGQDIPVELSVSDASDNVSTEVATVTITGTTAVLEHAAAGIQFVNPVQNNLHLLDIANQDIEQLEIYNLVGHKLITTRHESRVDISSLSSGIYLVNLHIGGRMYTQRFVKVD